jgi:hydrazine synthase alpha subunit-like protein
VVGQGLGQTRVPVSIWAIVGAAIGFVFLGHLAASPQTVSAKKKGAFLTNRPDIIFVQTSVLVPGPLAQRFPKGSRIVRLGAPAAKAVPVPLTNRFFAAADPQINFEGTTVLFSGQKNQGEPWQIWEMDLNGANPRQVTQCRQNCLRGAYLPANEIVFTVEESKGDNLHSYLAVVKTDGSGFRRISFGTASFQLETVLRDGRIVASAPWPLVESPEKNGSRLFYTLRPDGTALDSYRCEHQRPTIQTDADELEDGSIVFVRKGQDETSAGGELMRIQLGALHASSLSARQAVYESPRELTAEELLVAKEALAATNSAQRFDLYTFHLKSGTLGELLFSDPQFSSIQAVPVMPHVVPKHFWSTLNPDSNAGNFIALNSYLSVDESRGHFATPIAQVRVLTVNSSNGEEHSLGEAPVEADGSFYVQVPANWPVRFVLLDAKGRSIREERGWIWARPGENRGCPGCHGDKAVAPENHWPQTLRRFDTPTRLGDFDHGSATAQAK